MACECRENLKRLCLLQISTKLDVYQHLSLANSLSGGFKDQGDLSALFGGEAGSRRALQQVWSQSTCSIPRNRVVLFLHMQKKEAEGLPNAWGWVVG